jgi:regulator of sigma E protease
MVTTTSALISQGPDMVVILIAVFSASVGFTNLLPIPPLDGGKAVLVLLKVILRDRYPDAAGLRFQRLTFAGIIVFMIAINGIDLIRTLIGYQLPLGK